MVAESAGWARLVMEHLVQHHALVAAKRQFPREQFIENNTQAVNIAAAVDLVGLAAGLFRAHVGGRPQDLAVNGHGNLTGVALGQPKIHQPRCAVVTNHHVRWFDVTVHHPLIVSILQGVGDRDQQLGRLLKCEPARCEQVGQRHSLNELADQVRQTVDIAHVMD